MVTKVDAATYLRSVVTRLFAAGSWISPVSCRAWDSPWGLICRPIKGLECGNRAVNKHSPCLKNLLDANI
jgi:hypothetical protein